MKISEWAAGLGITGVEAARRLGIARQSIADWEGPKKAAPSVVLALKIERLSGGHVRVEDFFPELHVRAPKPRGPLRRES